MKAQCKRYRKTPEDLFKGFYWLPLEEVKRMIHMGNEEEQEHIVNEDDGSEEYMLNDDENLEDYKFSEEKETRDKQDKVETNQESDKNK